MGKKFYSLFTCFGACRSFLSYKCFFLRKKTEIYWSGGNPPSIGKRPIYFRFFLLKASLNVSLKFSKEIENKYGLNSPSADMNICDPKNIITLKTILKISIFGTFATSLRLKAWWGWDSKGEVVPNASCYSIYVIQ